MINYLVQLADDHTIRDFSAGNIILYQGEVPRSACLLLDGVVKVYSISSQGDEHIVSFHISGEFFPSPWIFKKATSTMFFYEALTHCKVALCPRQVLSDFMLAEKDRTEAVLDYFTTNYSAFLVRIHALEQSKAREKLVNTLFFLCQRYTKTIGGHVKVTIPISLTHQTLASLVGLTRETTAVEMNKLKQEKVINYKNQRYTVHLTRLLELIGEDSFRNISIAN